MTISIIIPVGPNHRHFLGRALKSVQQQTYQPVETIVVDDSGDQPQLADSWYEVITTAGRTGASAARNLGLKQAKGQWVLFLDADDTLLPRSLEHLVTASRHGDASYYYGDWWNVWSDQQRYYQAPEYDQVRFLHHNLHVVTALYPTQIARKIGGFDESMRGYEDWEFNVRLAVLGYCGKRVPKPVLAYHTDMGYRREWSRQNEKELIHFVHNRYREFVNGRRMAMCCGKSPQQNQTTFLATFGDQTIMSENDVVRMEYIGGNEGFVPWRNPWSGSGRVYRGGAGAYRYVDVDPRDVEFLVNTGAWRIVNRGDQSETPQIFGAEDDVILPTVEGVVTHDVTSDEAIEQAIIADVHSDVADQAEPVEEPKAEAPKVEAKKNTKKA